jgi:CDP-6-deoxy-D-xylo-4-hexulose-3-dehydrase
MKSFNIPLMQDNITKEDIQELIAFLDQENIPKLTNGPKVIEFEKKWSEWLGVKYSLMVNSGASANELTMLAIKYLYGKGEIIVPPLTWISDVASVLFADLTPVFCDINLTNLSFNIEQLKQKINENTKAIFVTHVLGINALTDELINICKEKNILLIEDVCESHGTTHKGTKVGSIGFASNFSFYFAHHMSTIEGGMICTNDEKFYQVCRALRSHGMIREMTNDEMKNQIINENLDLNKDFIFLAPAHNFRSTELNAVLGLSQIKNLDSNNDKRKFNFEYFMTRLNHDLYHTKLLMDGQCNYAFIVILKDACMKKRSHIEKTLHSHGIEFRRGLSGGGNQLKQPYFKKNYSIQHEDYPVINHIHDFSWYIGNYPSLETNKIDFLLSVLNGAFDDFS